MRHSTQQPSEPGTLRLVSPGNATPQPDNDDPSLDDILETLSPKQREAVLNKLGIFEDKMPKLHGLRRIYWGVIMASTIGWLILWTMITLALFCTILFAPVGILTWGLANMPMLYFGNRRREVRVKIFEKNQK
jgi:hypothetical protein